MKKYQKMIFFSLIGLCFTVQLQAAVDENANILLIGDSHSAGDLNGVSGCFGSETYKRLTEYRPQEGTSSFKVQMAAACGSASNHWLKSTVKSQCGLRACRAGQCSYTPYPQKGEVEGLEAQLNNAHPKMTIVELGTNMLGGSWSGKAGIEATVSAMINKIISSQSQCIWVGPPQPSERFLKKKKMTYESYLDFVVQLKRVVTKNNQCQFVDSSPYTDRNLIPQSDPLGVHYSCNEGKAWAKSVFEEHLKGSLDAMLVPNNELKDVIQ